MKMVSGAIWKLTVRASELWRILGELRNAFYEKGNKLELKADNGTRMGGFKAVHGSQSCQGVLVDAFLSSKGFF